MLKATTMRSHLRSQFNAIAVTTVLRKNDIAFAGVFGSYAKGTARRSSDVDLLVKFAKPKSLFSIVRVERELSRALRKKVDLVTEQSLSPYLKKEVLRDLKIIYGEKR